MSFLADSSEVGEAAGTFDLRIDLSGPRAVEVSADLVVSGTATAGVDYVELPPQVRFFPGQTTVVFPVTILDDSLWEGDETIVIELANPNLPDVTFGVFPTLTVTVVEDEWDPTTVIFSDGFEDGTATGWSSWLP